MLTPKAIADGSTYGRHVENNDYYSEGEKVTGRWQGRGAELLGLSGDVRMEDFDAVRQGLHPETGEFLRQRQSADRYGMRERDGEMRLEKLSTGRSLFDFTISAPKDLSILALEDSRMIDVHRQAVDETLVEIERWAGVGLSGNRETRHTSNLVIARYEHDTSRELDPQLHTHAVAANLSYDAVAGKWRALMPVDIYDRREYFTEFYRNAAARGVLKCGYEIEDHTLHGKDNGFGIKGIPEELREKFSVRSEQRDRAIAEFVKTNGRQPSNNEIARLVRDSRAEKLTEIQTAEVQARQYARMGTEHSTLLKTFHETALERGSIHQQAPAAASLAYAADHTFERVSVARDYELQAEALRHARGRIDPQELKGAMLAEVSTGAMLTARHEIATKQTLEREERMIASINGGRRQYEPLGKGHEFVVSDSMRPEQKEALLAILDNRDLAISLQGAAGTGKTAMQKEFKRLLNETRQSIYAVAPSTSAVEELQKVGFSDAKTIARLLADPHEQAQLRGQVLLIDEAGMVSSKDMDELIGLAGKHGARIVYSGDTQQLKSVSEGDALRVLERESKLQQVSLRQVQRQINAEYREAVETLRNHPAEGFERLEKMGAIREVAWLSRGQEAAKAYREALAVPNVEGKKRSVLVVAATHNEIKSVTFAIREDRKNAGEIGPGEKTNRHTALNWTEAQKTQFRRYKPGQVLEFHKATKGVAKNAALEVVSADKDGVKARKADGQEITVTKKQTRAYSVFEREEIEVAAGDKLLLQANYKDKAFKATNGELVTVAGVDGGKIRLEDGREIPSAYRQFAYGYAVTAHRSQGRTVDFEVISADRMDQELFYVSATRAREGLTVITSDSIALQESIGVSGDRQSATELARRAESAAAIKSGHEIAPEDYDLYQQFQQQQQQRAAHRQEPEIQQEITHHVEHEYEQHSISL
jgi:conjugative relaxase-like TrwC/TraI family protein